MLLITASGPDDIRFREMSAGHHYIEASLTEVVFFLRRGHLLPLAPAAESVKDLDPSHLTLIGYLNGPCTYTLYDDDGINKDFDLDKHAEPITVSPDGSVKYSGSRRLTFDAKIFKALPSL